MTVLFALYLAGVALVASAGPHLVELRALRGKRVCPWLFVRLCLTWPFWLPAAIVRGDR